jgi:hypothetical protein
MMRCIKAKKKGVEIKAQIQFNNARGTRPSLKKLYAWKSRGMDNDCTRMKDEHCTEVYSIAVFSSGAERLEVAKPVR